MSSRAARLRPLPEGSPVSREELDMRKIIYWVHISLDGYIEGPNGEFDWARMGPELSRWGREQHERVDTFLYGRRVWEMMSSYWPTVESVSDHPHDRWFAPIWRATPKIVFSRTLTSSEWATEVIDSVDRLKELKQAPGKDLLLTGGTELATGLANHGLIDEYHVGVHPVVLGGGKRVLPLAERRDLTLLGSAVYDDRVTVLRFA
jgi:dihydrofolate reductase